MRKTLMSLYKQTGEQGSTCMDTLLQQHEQIVEQGHPPTQDELLHQVAQGFLVRRLAIQLGLVDAELLVRHEDFVRGIKIPPDSLGKIQVFRESLIKHWPHSDFIHDYRIVDASAFDRKLATNGLRAYLDIVAMRIIPKRYEDFFNLVRYFAEHSASRCCTVNTFLFSDQDFVKYIGPNSSSCYRAVHYLIDIDGIPIEVQLRSAGVDAWARIHHATVYKPKITTSDKEREYVREFGRIANYVDCFHLAHL